MGTFKVAPTQCVLLALLKCLRTSVQAPIAFQQTFMPRRWLATN